MYRNLREFIAAVEALGVLRHVAGADPHHEVGGITEVAAGLPECPALLFDRIKGFAPGFRIFTNATTTPQRAALALGLDPNLRPLDALKAWMEKRGGLKPRPPVTVKEAPFLSNSNLRSASASASSTAPPPTSLTSTGSTRRSSSALPTRPPRRSAPGAPSPPR